MTTTRRKFIQQASAGVAIPAVASSIGIANELPKNHSEDTFHFSRHIPRGATYDLVVAGGGPAGTAAAVCAGRLGAKVLLLEATGCLGGMGSSGLVTAFDPMSNGERMLVGGFMKEVVDTMFKRGFLAPRERPNLYGKKYNHWTPFNVEGYKLTLDDFVSEAGVEVRFFTRLVDVDCDPQQKRIDGVIINNIEGFSYIKAKTFVDSTGDAVLTDLCGADCREAGRDTPNIMPSTICSYFSNINYDAVTQRAGTNSEVLSKAIADGHFTQPDKHLPGVFRIGDRMGNLNGGHIFNLNALRNEDLSKGMMWGRKLAQEYLSYYRKYVPGFENVEHATTASLMGVRESRRIVGEYELSFDDYISRRSFPDQIGVFNKFIDVHPYSTDEEEFERFMREKKSSGRLKPGEYFGIPYSILVPKGWRNLWVAGRCTSSDVKVHGSIRVQPAASMMGQAAGTAAVQAIRTGQSANDLDTELLVTTLRDWNAYLPQETLSKSMTRV